MSSRILSTSGAAAINAVTPPDRVATFGLRPPSSSRVTSLTLPNRIVSSHGAMSAGSTPDNGTTAPARAGPSASQSAITAQLAAEREMNWSCSPGYPPSKYGGLSGAGGEKRGFLRPGSSAARALRQKEVAPFQAPVP